MRFDTSTSADAASCVVVSPEMIAWFGAAPASLTEPADATAFVIRFDEGEARPTLHLCPTGEAAAVAGNAWRVTFLIAREALLRLGGARLLEDEGTGFHLPPELCAVALALRHAGGDAALRDTLRLAKSIEFVCETIRLAREGGLTPLAGAGDLSAADTRRVMAARRLIEERGAEKLTLHAIARACGLNRAKLTRGFRELYDCTVAEAIAAHRLGQASRLLLTTDLPVSTVGYEAGYQNNASFARAFGRRFGRTPSDYRAMGALAA